ncbi:MAG: T9SS type A sorting domain-containing protein [Reichenbachiella sp.]|uniref:T9SS type A sorting domain-containing protein n=1 Tax=Reichenbachiella sp. TaxID=2184521 RepID=UPI0032669AE6
MKIEAKYVLLGLIILIAPFGSFSQTMFYEDAVSTGNIWHSAGSEPTNPTLDATNYTSKSILNNGSASWEETQIFPSTYTIQSGDKFYISFYNPNGASNWQLKMDLSTTGAGTWIGEPSHVAHASSGWNEVAVDLSAYAGEDLTKIAIYPSAGESKAVYYDETYVNDQSLLNFTYLYRDLVSTGTIWHSAGSEPANPTLDAINHTSKSMLNNGSAAWEETQIFPNTYTIQSGDKFYISFYNPNEADNWQLKMDLSTSGAATWIGESSHAVRASSGWNEVEVDLATYVGEDLTKVTIYPSAAESKSVYYDEIYINDQSLLEFTVNAPYQRVEFQTIIEKTFGDAAFTLSATASSGLGLSYSVVSGPIMITGSEVTITGAGEATIAADQAGNGEYNAASQETQTFTILKADQTITIEAITDRLTSETSPIIINATTDSGLELTYSISGPATIDGNTLTLDGTSGTVSVMVNQAGDANYNAATESSTSFNVSDPAKTNQEITFEAITEKAFGEAAFTLNATASSGLDVSYSVVSGPIMITGSAVTITGAGEATIAADQAGNGGYNAASQETQTFAIQKADQTITIETITDRLTSETSPIIINASTDSGLELTYSISGPAAIDGNMITLDGTSGVVSVMVNQAGDANYNAAAESSTSFNVSDPVITSIENSVIEEFKIFPNPTSDWMTIRVPTSIEDKTLIEVYSLEGAKMLSEEMKGNMKRIKLNNFREGIYLLIFSRHNFTTTTKFLVER